MIRTAIPTGFRSTPTRRYCQGVTLPELGIVVALLGIVAATAIPNLSSNENQRLRLAAQEIRNAVSHARDESIRTGTIHSVEFYPAEHQVLVVQIDDFGATSLVRPVVYHPTTKQLYQLDLDDDAPTAGSQVQSATLNFDSTGAQPRVDFTSTGQPVYIDLADQAHRLLSGSITIALNGQARTIAIDPFTGRTSEP